MRRTSFSRGGTQQLLRDVAALAALFGPLGAAPHSVLHRLNESCTLLSLGVTARSELLAAILAPPAPDARRGEHEARLRRRMEAAHVFRLSVGEAAELLSSSYAD